MIYIFRFSQTHPINFPTVVTKLLNSAKFYFEYFRARIASKKNVEC
jgi:hypothetical protein